MSGRKLVQKFSGHLAHLLNTGDNGVVELGGGALGTLHWTLLRTLVGGAGRQGDGNDEHRNVQYLVGWPLFASDVTPAQAADTYFQRVLNRPLFLARANHVHKGHRLFLALCERGLDKGWKTAELVRSKVLVPQDLSRSPPPVFSYVSGQLKGHRGVDISPGNPAHSTRPTFGPLYLKVFDHFAEVPEELSIWQAICCAPPRLVLLQETEFKAFKSLVLKAVEDANTPYGVRVALGLGPTDWDDIATNTLKAISAFRSRCRAVAKETGDDADSITVWQQAWATHPIPKFLNVEEFRSSRLGRYFWLGTRGATEPPPSIDLKRIDEFAQAGILDPYDVWFLRGLAQKKSQAKMARSLRTLRKFGQFEIPKSFIIELSARIRAYVERIRTDEERE